MSEQDRNNEEFCKRCLPELLARPIGYIPLPEPSNAGDSRYEDQRILLCERHYFDAKKNCFYVIPFDREDDPVDSFLTRINSKHKEIRGSLKLKYGSQKNAQKAEREGVANKVHFLEDNRTVCGLPVSRVVSTTTRVDDLTCKNCLHLLNSKALDQEPLFTDEMTLRC